jgi:GTPase SAR1 family protein
LETLQVLMSYGATWDVKCDELVFSGKARKEAPALRICMSLWSKEIADGFPFTNIPFEVIGRGVASTQAFICELKTSTATALRRKICLVGSSCAGKTSLVKSITSKEPQLEHVDDRTIGIDYFSMRFVEPNPTSDGSMKIHEVTFWDFAGQDAYQVAHSLFFSPRTLYLVCVDLGAFAIAYMQAVIFADHNFQETKLLDEFVEDSVMRWVRLIVARQPDAEFVFIATKEDALADNIVTEELLKECLMAKLEEVNTTVQHVTTTDPTVVFVSCTSLASTQDARTKIEHLIAKSGDSFEMPDTYTRVLKEIVKIREEAKTKGIDTRISEVFAPVDSLPDKLGVEPDLCRTILQTLHDLGDVLWYEDLGVALLGKSVILEPLLLIDYIRQVFNHKKLGQILPHHDLQAMDYWVGLDGNEKLMEAMKQLLQAFHLVYSADEYRVMQWDSDLIVPAFWQTKTPASWKFLGDILRINAIQSHEGEAVRIHWEYDFKFNLPPPFFDHLVVASVSPSFAFDAGPDWIMYKDEEVAACRIMVNRDPRSLHRTIDVEAVVSETASPNQVANLWASFQKLSGAFVKVLREYPGLRVSSFVWTNNEFKPKENMKDLLWSTSTRPFVKWLPPVETWDWFKRLVTGQDRDQTIEEDWEGL